jgi:hypothetical protein
MVIRRKCGQARIVHRSLHGEVIQTLPALVRHTQKPVLMIRAASRASPGLRAHRSSPGEHPSGRTETNCRSKAVSRDPAAPDRSGMPALHTSRTPSNGGMPLPAASPNRAGRPSDARTLLVAEREAQPEGVIPGVLSRMTVIGSAAVQAAISCLHGRLSWRI